MRAVAPEDPIPDGADDPEVELRPDDPSEGLDTGVPGVDDPAEGLAPEPPDIPDESDADPELRREFWSLVLLFNVALFGMSFGAMLVGFEGRWRVGGAIFAVGAVAFARGWRGYRRATADAGDGSASDTDADDD